MSQPIDSEYITWTLMIPLRESIVRHLRMSQPIDSECITWTLTIPLRKGIVCAY